MVLSLLYTNSRDCTNILYVNVCSKNIIYFISYHWRIRTADKELSLLAFSKCASAYIIHICYMLYILYMLIHSLMPAKVNDK